MNKPKNIEQVGNISAHSGIVNIIHKQFVIKSYVCFI